MVKKLIVTATSLLIYDVPGGIQWARTILNFTMLA